jgi:hypothetical protein
MERSITYDFGHSSSREGTLGYRGRGGGGLGVSGRGVFFNHSPCDPSRRYFDVVTNGNGVISSASKCHSIVDKVHNPDCGYN